MDFSHSPKVQDLQARVQAFMTEHIYPAEPVFEAQMKAFRAAGNPWQEPQVMEDLKRKARAAGRIPKSLLSAFLPVTLAEPVLKRAMSMGAGCLSSDIRPPQWRRQLAMMRLLLTGRL